MAGISTEFAEKKGDYEEVPSPVDWGETGERGG